MGKDPTVVEHIMVGVEEQAKEYQILSNQMGRILQGLTRIPTSKLFELSKLRTSDASCLVSYGYAPWP